VVAFSSTRLPGSGQRYPDSDEIRVSDEFERVTVEQGTTLSYGELTAVRGAGMLVTGPRTGAKAFFVMGRVPRNQTRQGLGELWLCRRRPIFATARWDTRNQEPVGGSWGGVLTPPRRRRPSSGTSWCAARFGVWGGAESHEGGPVHGGGSLP
jgi:hypothetical protein